MPSKLELIAWGALLGVIVFVLVMAFTVGMADADDSDQEFAPRDYDTNGNCMIEVPEILAAIDQYKAGERPELTIRGLLTLIDHYKAEEAVCELQPPPTPTPTPTPTATPRPPPPPPPPPQWEKELNQWGEFVNWKFVCPNGDTYNADPTEYPEDRKPDWRPDC